MITKGNVHRCFSIASITITTSLSYNFVSDEEIKPSGVKRCFTALTVFKFNLKHCHSLNHGPLAALRAVTETSIQVTPPSKMVLSQCQCQGGIFVLSGRISHRQRTFLQLSSSTTSTRGTSPL